MKNIIEAINKNYWLSGRADTENGDMGAGLELNEQVTQIITVKGISKLWDYLSKEYTGTFKYEHFYFINTYHYGCFLFVEKKGEIEEFEHLTISAYTKEEFIKFVKHLKKIYEKCEDVKDFVKIYFR